MKNYLLVPFHGTALLLVGTCTLGLLLAWQAGVIGMALGLLVISWFFKYCFVVLDSLIAGEESIPVLSVEMVNPVSEQRPVALAALITAEIFLSIAIRRHLGTIPGVVTAGVLAFILPAHIAVLGITRNPFHALWPPALIGLIRALRHDYLLLNAATLTCAGIAYAALLYPLPFWATLAGVQLSLLLTFSLVGGAVFEHRHELGIDTLTRAERIAARDARDLAAQRQQMLDRAYAKFQVSKPIEGWQELESWLRLPGDADTSIREQRALLEATSKWNDVRSGDRLANDLIVTLLGRRQNGEALKVAEARLQTNPSFRMSDPALATRLAGLAGVAGKRSLQRRLSAQK